VRCHQSRAAGRFEKVTPRQVYHFAVTTAGSARLRKGPARGRGIEERVGVIADPPRSVIEMPPHRFVS